MAFMLGKHLVFLDSFQFMASSLERLADNLPADNFNYTSQAFKGEKLALMKKKGVCPYDYAPINVNPIGGERGQGVGI